MPLTLETIPLACLRTGECARMRMAHLSLEDCELLRAMGLCEECELRVCRSGEPCIVEIHATRLGLSNRVSRRILVSLSPRPAEPARV